MKLIAMERKLPELCGTLGAAAAWRLGATILILAFTCASSAQKPAFLPPTTHIENKYLRVEFDRALRSRVIARFQNKDIPLGVFAAGETVVAGGKIWTQFHLISEKSEPIREGVGAGHRLTLAGKAGNLTKTVVVTAYDDFPAMAFFDVQYTNNGRTSLAITKWVN